MLNGKPADLYLKAFEICKLQASADGAFPDVLLEHWFKASWDLCVSMVGYVGPAQAITEKVIIRQDGSFRLSHRPTSEIKLYNGATLVAVFPPSLEMSDRWLCRPSLCCYCDLIAQYRIGDDDPCKDEMSPRFVQAVARLFTYICENRGDVELDDQVLGKCGAKAFLGADLAYVL